MKPLNTGKVQYSANDVANPPTEAEMTTAFGTPATRGAGWMGVIWDGGAGANFYLCVSNGANWSQVALTAGA